MKYKKVLVIGSGVAGSTLARVLADAGWMVDLFEKRCHIAGNCYDEYDKNGVLVHKYGPHYFRSNNIYLLRWLSNFTDWIPGRYYVRAKVGKELIPLPISISTITALKGVIFSRNDFKQYIKKERVLVSKPRNAKEQCLNLVGNELYQAIFKGYTTKQWAVAPEQLDPSITARIPFRLNWDERYSSDKYQVMPKSGYSQMFRQMLKHSSINVTTNCYLSAAKIRKLRDDYDCTVYTGPIDDFFDFRYGNLEYRSLGFRWKYYKQKYIQPCVQINYPNDFKYTRIVEAKHVTGQDYKGTTLCYEYPKLKGEPFYPLLTKKSLRRYSRYKDLANKESNRTRPIYFVGRLAEYRYLDMDCVFIRAIQLANKILGFKQVKL